jgi:hypothetical protein
MLVFSAGFLLGRRRFVMRKKRFSVEQIVAVLKQADPGLPVADLIRQIGVTEVTYYLYERLSRCKQNWL